MTPIQTFGQTAAPSNMMFPTAAYLQASQNAAEMQARGMGELGKGLAGGINAVAGAYSDYKKMQSNVKASEKAYDTFRSFLDPEVQRSIDTRIEEMNKDTGVSLQDKAAFWDQAKAVMGGAINQKFAIDKQQQELNAAAARQREQIASQEMMPFRQQAASLLFGAPGSSAGLAPQNFSIQPTQPTQPTNMFGGHY